MRYLKVSFLIDKAQYGKPSRYKERKIIRPSLVTVFSRSLNLVTDFYRLCRVCQYTAMSQVGYISSVAILQFKSNKEGAQKKKKNANFSTTK